MNKKTKNGFIKIILGIVGALLLVFASLCIYSSFYYKAVDVDNYLTSSNGIEVIEENDYFYFKNTTSNTALIFYPGGKVEYTAYAPLMMEFAKNGISCFLFKMPFNLALFGTNSADKIMHNYTYYYSAYYIGGHSLGGVCASQYAYNHQDKISGVLLLAAYTTKDFSNSSLKFMSIYGSNDNVLNIDSYNKNKANLPTNLYEYIINGGNHSNFGSYGLQKNDKKPTITSSEQIKITVEQFKGFIG